MELYYGFKKLTIENILEPDTLGIPCEINHKEWVSYALPILEPKLSEGVPLETRKLFEVARGTLVYGLYFYPLYSLGTEQLFRVSENALKQKCIALGLQFNKGKMYFKPMLDKLIALSVIPEDRKEVWICLWKLRNISSHPEAQNIITQSWAIDMLKAIAGQINFLFGS